MRRQYKKYKVLIREDGDGYYYGLIYHPKTKEFITSTSGRNDIPSVMAQAEELIEENIRKFSKKKSTRTHVISTVSKLCVNCGCSEDDIYIGNEPCR